MIEVVVPSSVSVDVSVSAATVRNQRIDTDTRGREDHYYHFLLGTPDEMPGLRMILDVYVNSAEEMSSDDSQRAVFRRGIASTL
jgi:hypothetical protein